MSHAIQVDEYQRQLDNLLQEDADQKQPAEKDPGNHKIQELPEQRAGRRPRFEEMDENHDGFINRAEANPTPTPT